LIEDIKGNVDSKLPFKSSIATISQKNIEITFNYLQDLHAKTSIPVTWVGPFLEYRWEVR